MRRFLTTLFLLLAAFTAASAQVQLGGPKLQGWKSLEGEPFAAATVLDSNTSIARYLPMYTSPPDCHRKGQMFYRTSNDTPYYCTATGSPGTWTAFGSGGGAGTPGGANTELQFNSSGSFAGDPDLTFAGDTLTVTKLNTPKISNLTTNGMVFTTGGDGTLNTNLGTTCTNTVAIGISATAQPVCASVTNALISNGTIDLAAKVTGALPVANGGTGIASGTSGGVPYFSASSTIASSPALTANKLVKGGGAGAAPTASLAGDDGTTFTYTGAGGVSLAPGTGVAGTFTTTEGTAPSLTADSFSIYAATNVAVGGLAYVLPAAAATGLMYSTNSSGVMTVSHDGESKTKTFTNTTIDVEGTGNVITTAQKTWFQSAGCNSSVASSMLDLPTTLAPSPTCQTGTNTQTATLDFPDSDGMFSAQVVFALPGDFTGTVDAKVKWKAAATSGDVIWNVATICVADAETDDPAFNTASTVTDTAKGTTLQMNDASITGVTITGCAAGELMHVKVSRDRTTSGDTIVGVVSFYGIEITSRRAQ